jgi:hypothetical protein
MLCCILVAGLASVFIPASVVRFELAVVKLACASMTSQCCHIVPASEAHVGGGSSLDYTRGARHIAVKMGADVSD